MKTCCHIVWVCLFACAKPSVPISTSDSVDSGSIRADRPIGTAEMRADGTLVLMLRAESKTGGALGDAMFTYAPNHPQYRKMVDHLGGIKPGETKSVPPFPESK